MYYYFDESGNWQYPLEEKRRLLIAGMLISDDTLRKELMQEIQIFKQQQNMGKIHATDIKNIEIKEELYRLINRFVQRDEIEVLVHTLRPKVLMGSTIKDADELYIDIASRLISDMSFGDNDLDIEYDMKFHYAYPQNIVDHFNAQRGQEYINMEKNFILSPEGYKTERRRVLANISRVLEKSKSDYTLQEVYETISDEKNTDHKSILEKYIWTEFRLKTQKSSFIKDKFKDKIEDYSKQKCKLFSLPYESAKSKIRYKHKHYQSAGVQTIDVICNLVWRYGEKPPQNVSSSVKSIYDNITIKDISDEI